MALSTTVTMAFTGEDIIAQVVALVPPPTAPASDLVKVWLLQVIAEDKLKAISTRNNLVNLPISGSLSDVLEGPIPHRTWLAALGSELTKARESGHLVTAIRHPTQGDLTLPLWALL